MTISRRQFVEAAPSVLFGVALISGCAPGTDPEGYESLAAEIRRAGSRVGAEDAALRRELVRHATLAPSSHNTQCWKFALETRGNHHTRGSDRGAVLRWTRTNITSLYRWAVPPRTSSTRHWRTGSKAEADFDVAREAIHVALTPTTAEASPLFNAIAARQCTRGDYDSKPLSNEELGLLERAGTSTHVRMLLITGLPAVERVLDYVVQANSAQMADPAFVRELKSWIRFNGAAAVRTRRRPVQRSHGQPDGPDVAR